MQQGSEKSFRKLHVQGFYIPAKLELETSEQTRGTGAGER